MVVAVVVECNVEMLVCVCNGADGLDSAGCSPKDDEDDDSDEEVAAMTAAAATKHNKISPACSCYPGSSYYYPMFKQKPQLAGRNDRQHQAEQSENSRGRLEPPSDDSYYNPYQQSDSNVSGDHGLSGNNDVARQRMMRRKQARREREAAGMTTADSVEGYRGRDCSIDELIKYIDAKPPNVPKPGQKQTTRCKKRKKKRGGSNVKSTVPVSGPDACSANNLDQTRVEKSGDVTAVSADSTVSSTNEPETPKSSDDYKVDLKSASELPLYCDTLCQTLPPSEGSSSSIGDSADGFRHCDQSVEACNETVELSSVIMKPEGGGMAVKPDARPSAVNTPPTQSTGAVSVAKMDEFENFLSSSACSKLCHKNSCNEESRLTSETYRESNGVSQADADVCRSEVIAVDAGNFSGCISSSCMGLCEIELCTVSRRRHSADVRCTTSPREITYQHSEDACRSICGSDTGKSTPSSSISGAHHSHSFDSQSLADDVSSDVDCRSVKTSLENDFTVVTTHKKKKKTKKLLRQKVAADSCLWRTFHSGILHRDSSLQNEYVRQEAAGTEPTAAMTMCMSTANSSQLHSAPVSQQTSTLSEMSSVAQSVQLCEGRTGVDAVGVSDVDSNVTDATVLCPATGRLSGGENNSSFRTCSSADGSHSSAPSAAWSSSSADKRTTREKLFLDTRRPRASRVRTAAAVSELSFWYDVTVSDNQCTSARPDTDCTKSLSALGLAAEPSDSSSSGTVADLTFVCSPVAVSSLSSQTSTDVNTGPRLNVDQHETARLSSAADAGSLLLSGNECRLRQQPDDLPQVRRQPSFRDSCVTTTVTSSTVTLAVSCCDNSCDDMDSTAVTECSDVLVGRSTTASTASRHSFSPVISASTTPHSHSCGYSSSHSRHCFQLRDAQLFLYSG